MGELQDEARRLLDAATPGPWEWKRLTWLRGAVQEGGRRTQIITLSDDATDPSSADAELIEEAPRLVAGLLAALDDRDAALVAARQELWDIFAALGGNTDGDPTPAAVVGLEGLALKTAREYRAEMEAECDRLENVCVRCGAALGSVSAVPTAPDVVSFDRVAFDEWCASIQPELEANHLPPRLPAVPTDEARHPDTDDPVGDERCPDCGGSGIIGAEFSDEMGYPGRECSTCGGTGWDLAAVPTEPAAPPEDALWPLHKTDGLRSIVAELERIGTATGDYTLMGLGTSKGGVELNITFENEVDGATIGREFAERLMQCPSLLADACRRLLAADAAYRAVPLSVEEASPEPEPIGATEPPTPTDCPRCGAHPGAVPLDDRQKRWGACPDCDGSGLAAPSVAPAPPSAAHAFVRHSDDGRCVVCGGAPLDERHAPAAPASRGVDDQREPPT